VRVSSGRSVLTIGSWWFEDAATVVTEVVSDTIEVTHDRWSCFRFSRRCLWEIQRRYAGNVRVVVVCTAFLGR
jgi:hypothetical protein